MAGLHQRPATRAAEYAGQRRLQTSQPPAAAASLIGPPPKDPQATDAILQPAGR